MSPGWLIMSFAGAAFSTVCVHGLCAKTHAFADWLARRGVRLATPADDLKSLSTPMAAAKPSAAFIVCDGGMNNTNNHVNNNSDGNLVILDDNMGCCATLTGRRFGPGLIGGLPRRQAVRAAGAREAGLTARRMSHMMKNPAAARTAARV